jgi:hypothetical protein
MPEDARQARRIDVPWEGTRVHARLDRVPQADRTSHRPSALLACFPGYAMHGN